MALEARQMMTYTEEEYKILDAMPSTYPEMLELFSKKGYKHGDVEAAISGPYSWSDSWASVLRYEGLRFEHEGKNIMERPESKPYITTWQTIKALMYSTPLQQMPKYLNTDFSWIAKWRLRINR